VAAQEPEQPVRLTIHPAPAPSPALKYQFVPEPADLQPGNAALLYYRAFSPEWFHWLREPHVMDKIEAATQQPLKDLPHKDIDWLLGTKQLEEVDLAARREYCDWEYTPRLRKEGIYMLLPDVQSFRQFAYMLAVRARLQLAARQYDKAVYSLQTGFALGRDVANAPLLINALAGTAMANQMLPQIETMIQTPDSPNLYWALTGLPRPFIDLRKPLLGERIWLEATVPLVHELETVRFGPERQQQLTEQLVRAFRIVNERGSEEEAKLVLMGLALKFYPEGKEELIAEGRKPADVEALPVIQVYAIHALRQFRKLQDELFKWHSLPYSEAAPGIEAADKEIRETRKHFEGFPFIDLLPAYDRGFLATTQIDRRIAALRCIEAIRLYAAAHGGALPSSLAEIHEVPVPVDPGTGRPFTYRPEGDRATLHPSPPVGYSAPPGVLTYELTLKR
jgi:hypothetical protein